MYHISFLNLITDNIWLVDINCYNFGVEHPTVFSKSFQFYINRFYLINTAWYNTLNV